MRSVFSLDGRSAMYMDLSAHLTKNPQRQVTRDGAKLHMMSVESLLPVVRPHMEVGVEGCPPVSHYDLHRFPPSTMQSSTLFAYLHNQF